MVRLRPRAERREDDAHAYYVLGGPRDYRREEDLILGGEDAAVGHLVGVRVRVGVGGGLGLGLGRGLGCRGRSPRRRRA